MKATKQEKHLKAVGHALKTVLTPVYGENVGFFLCVYIMDGEPGVADYISNGRRDDIIKALRETAKKLEKGEIIPVTQGEA